MAYVGKKDITTVTWNTTKALMPWVESISGLKLTAVMEERTPMGSAWPAPVDTGCRTQDDIVIEFLYDSASTPTPNADIALAQSATLLITLGTNQTITGTFLVADMSIEVADEKINRLTVTFKPSGTITWDLLAA
jgi:hypothetical protein